MQESYISLDPANADSMTAQQRGRVYNSRWQEAVGGEAGSIMANQCTLTSMLISYTVMRSKGFRVTPFNASKIPALGGLILAGYFGHSFGLAYSTTVLGDKSQYKYLMSQRGPILKGTKPFDAPQAEWANSQMLIQPARTNYQPTAATATATID